MENIEVIIKIDGEVVIDVESDDYTISGYINYNLGTLKILLLFIGKQLVPFITSFCVSLQNNKPIKGEENIH